MNDIDEFFEKDVVEFDDKNKLPDEDKKFYRYIVFRERAMSSTFRFIQKAIYSDDLDELDETIKKAKKVWDEIDELDKKWGLVDVDDE